MTNDIVPFYGQNLITAKDERDGREFVAMKPLCDNLGLEWEPQRKRIQRDEVLRVGASMMEVPTNGGIQEMVLLPLEYLNGWLFGVDISRLKDQATRERLLVYKKECYAALYTHWSRKTADSETKARIDALEKGQEQLYGAIKTMSEAIGELSRNISQLALDTKRPTNINVIGKEMFVTIDPSTRDDPKKKEKFIKRIKEVIEANEQVSQSDLLSLAGYSPSTNCRRWLHEGIGEHWHMTVLPGTKYVYFPIEEQ